MNLPLAWIDEEVSPPEVPPALIPWEDNRFTILPALGATLREVLFSPTAFFRSLGLTRDLRMPLYFSLLVCTVGTLASLYWYLLQLATGNTGNSWWDHMGFILPPLGPHLVVGVVLMVPLYVFLRQFVLSVFLFGALKLVGGQQATFTVAFRLTAYTQAALLAHLIPWLGGVIASIWLFILELKALQSIFSFSLLRAFIIIVVSSIFQLIVLVILFLLASLLGLTLGWKLLFA